MHIPGHTPMLKQYKKLQHNTGRRAALKICHIFFDAFGVERPAEILKKLVTIFLQVDDEEIDGRARGNMIFFLEYIVPFIKAVAVLVGKSGRPEVGKSAR